MRISGSFLACASACLFLAWACGSDDSSDAEVDLGAFSNSPRDRTTAAAGAGPAIGSAGRPSNSGSVPEGQAGAPSLEGAGGASSSPQGNAAGAAAAPVVGAGGATVAAGGAGPIGAGGALNAGGSAALGGSGGGGNQPLPIPGGGTLLFSENFEGINLGALTGTVNRLRPERTVSIINEAGRGRVLQVQAGSRSENRAGVFLENLAAPNNSHFGRMFVRVAQFPGAGGDHWVVLEATANANRDGEKVRPVGGQFQRWALGSDGPSAGDWTDWDQSDAETVAGAWECVEWQVNGANGGNDMVLWVDGLEVRPRDRGNFALPVINVLWFGWVVFQDAQPPQYDVRFDDIVISTARVGCN
jgi:hypothetical protein